MSVESFRDKLVVVTGAGSGIGKATALAFAREGARVIAADIDREAAEVTAAQGPADRMTPFAVDVADVGAMHVFASEVADAHGVPDVVINNAGIGLAGRFLDSTDEEIDRIVDVNLWGVIHGCRLFGEQMVRAGKGGQIVNTASAAAFTPSRELPVYAMTKAAVLMLSESIRPEFRDAGIGVSAICPGIIDTNITRTSRWAGLDEAEQQMRRDATARLYQRRGYGPEKVAEAILRAVRRDTPMVPVSPEAKAARALSRISPRAMRWLARRHVAPR
jgi:NAD(P)-dependent dehydrogenase (short-subunit alcohol dehydrogenase family)